MIPYGLLLRIGLVLALAAAAAWGWHLFVNHYREQGRVEIRAEWDAEKLAQAKELHRRTENAERAKQETTRKAEVLARSRAQRFAALQAETQVVASGAGVRLPADSVGLFDRARAAAEASRPAGGTAEAAPAAAGSTEGYVVSLYEWAAQCLERDGLWRDFYKGVQDAFAEGK